MARHETDRRGFFGNLARGLAGAAFLTPRREADPQQDGAAISTAYPHTSKTIDMNGSEVRIVGVQHTDENLKQWKEYLVDQFRDKQMLMLESCYVQSISRMPDGSVSVHGDGYFSKLAMSALASGKKAFDVDIWDVPQHVESVVLGAGLACKLGGLALVQSSAANILLKILDKSNEGKQEKSEEKPRENVDSVEPTDTGPNRRQALGRLGGTLAIPALLATSMVAAPTSVTESVQSQFQSGSDYPSVTLNYVSDARTVFMLKSIREILADNPGMNAAVIVGDEHAKGMLHYIDNPKEFQAKVELYERMYKPIWGNTYKELLPGE